jgi:hypothetical protein
LEAVVGVGSRPQDAVQGRQEAGGPMSDRELRELELASASGDDALEAWLRAGLRSGALVQSQVALAARLGAQVAQRVSGVPRLARPWTNLRFERWIGKLLDPSEATDALHFRSLCVRGAIGAARAALPPWEAVFPGDPAVAEIIAAAEAWCECPCDKHAEALSAARRFELHPLLAFRVQGPRDLLPARRRARRALEAAGRIQSIVGLGFLRIPEPPSVEHMAEGFLEGWGDQAQWAGAAAGVNAVCQGIHDELVPWLLSSSSQPQARD